VRRLGDAPFEHVRAFVDDIVAVSEDEILEAMRRLALRVRLVAEPSGAVTFAAHLFHRDELPATRINVAIVSGGNVDPHLLARVLGQEEATGHRL
jgi:threonine dehydratase